MKQSKCVILGIALLGNQRVHEREQWKTDNYEDFKTETSRISKIK